jgi:ribosomal protein S18 acetylase RimI-like enzyme
MNTVLEQKRQKQEEGTNIAVRAATPADDAAIWRVLSPAIAAGESLTLPRDMSAADAVAYWRAPGSEVFVAEMGGEIVGAYYIRANRQGGGAHVANCGYATAPEAAGRGVARAMCAHSLDHARARGFRAMQFNFVVSTNTRAVRLWQSFGLEIVGTIPEGFKHPTLGYVDAFVMYRKL